MDQNTDDIHLHCQDCFLAHCNAHSNCKVVRCYLNCGLAFHRCKMKEHVIICKMSLISCPNAVSGCPSKIVRHEIARHLEVCPASVVHCAMEWNRYPIYSRDKYALSNVYVSSRDRIEQVREHWIPFLQPNPPKIKGQLDVELAFHDQKRLEIQRRKRMRIGKWKTDQLYNRSPIDPERIKAFQEVFSSSNHIPSLELLQDKGQSDRNPGEKDTDQDRSSKGKTDSDEVETADDQDRICAISDQTGMDQVKTDRDQGKCHSQVKDHLSDSLHNQNVSKCKDQSFDNDIDHIARHDAVSFSSDAEHANNHCVKNAKSDTHATDKSFSETEHLKCSENRIKSGENDLEIISPQGESSVDSKNAVVVQNKQPTIPSFPEKCRQGVDLPFFPETLGLNIVIETLPKFQRQHAMYNLACEQDFRRDQYCDHFQNVHADIHGGLNGWIQERCPLAQYGCTYIRRRLNPLSKDGLVVFSDDLGSFGVVPHSHSIKTGIPENEIKSCSDRLTSDGRHCEGADVHSQRTEKEVLQNSKSRTKSESEDENGLLSLPLELIDKITSFIDSFSLNNLSRTCKTMREICRNLLFKRGIVVFEWERRNYDNGSAGWKVAKLKWRLSNAFSPIRKWKHSNQPSISVHLMKCPFYKRIRKRDKIRVIFEGVEHVHLGMRCTCMPAYTCGICCDLINAIEARKRETR